MCRGGISPAVRVDRVTCSKRCRQAWWRFKHAVGPAAPARDEGDHPRTFAYADPPYLGKHHYYTENRAVSYMRLLEDLHGGFSDGWAVSCAADDLYDVMGYLHAWPCTDARVAAWVKRGRYIKTRRPQLTWEPVIVRGGRPQPIDHPTAVEDSLVYRGRFHAWPGAMIGMKSPQFAVWVFKMLGARQGDTLYDLFPGSGIVTRSWELYTGGECVALPTSQSGPSGVAS
jgi:hypothetical protein